MFTANLILILSKAELSETTSIIIYRAPSNSIIPYSGVDTKGIELIKVTVPEGLRYVEFLFNNSNLLSINEALPTIWHILTNNRDYILMGDSKIIMTHVIGLVQDSDPIEISLHSNVAVNKNTTFNQFFNIIKGKLKGTFLEGYSFDVPNLFRVRVWKADHLKNTNIRGNRSIDRLARTTELLKESNRLFNADRPKERAKSQKVINRLEKFLKNRQYSTYNNKNVISPLTRSPSSIKPFSSLFIETVSVNSVLVPKSISCKVG